MLETVLESLNSGNMIMLHDSSDRENEIDLVLSAKYTKPEHIAYMRQFAGGLICIAVDDVISKNIQLQYLHETLKLHPNPQHQKMIYQGTKYGDHPSFSMWINHTDAKTGITDQDRALAANEMARLAQLNPKTQINYFTKMFKMPGHVPLLKSAPGLLKTRQGHTEMSTYLMKLAGMPPVSVICEMMDPVTHTALSIEKATKYAKINNIEIIDVSEVVTSQEIFV